MLPSYFITFSFCNGNAFVSYFLARVCRFLFVTFLADLWRSARFLFVISPDSEWLNLIHRQRIICFVGVVMPFSRPMCELCAIETQRLNICDEEYGNAFSVLKKKTAKISIYGAAPPLRTFCVFCLMKLILKWPFCYSGVLWSTEYLYNFCNIFLLREKW